MRRFLVTCAYTLLVVQGTACAEPGCTLSLVAGVVVEIRDAADDGPLAEGARGAVHDGSYTDSLQPAGGIGGQMVTRAAAYERPGVYLVRVEHDGYADWETAGVWVRGDECHVETVELTALLEREP